MAIQQGEELLLGKGIDRQGVSGLQIWGLFRAVGPRTLSLGHLSGWLSV
jgi:hypothetical protein